MKQQIQEVLISVTSFSEIHQEITKLFAHTRKNHPSNRIGYVSGIISSDGPEHMDRNIKILKEYTEKLRDTHDFPIFSATDVFSDEIFGRLGHFTSHRRMQEEFMQFWRDIFDSGHITDIFMTPRWEKSEGAKDELETAKKLNLKIHYIKP
jgi:hypothetical protein